MGVRNNFSGVGKVDILVVHFGLLTTQMQIDVHITFAIPQRKWPTLLQQSQKCASLAAMFLFTPYKTRWQQYFFSVFTSYVSFHTVTYCYQQSLHYLPQMSAFDSSDARLFFKNKQANLKNKPKMGNLTEKQAQRVWQESSKQYKTSLLLK